MYAVHPALPQGVLWPYRPDHGTSILEDVNIDRNGLEILSRGECLELLASRPVGRVAVTSMGRPAILPVTFQLVDEDVIFATGTGSKSLAVKKGTVLAFEVDDVEAASRAGWSVLVVGTAQELDRRQLLSIADRLDLRPWVGPHATKLVRLPAEHLSGRRLGPRHRPSSAWRGRGGQPPAGPSRRPVIS